MQKFTGLQYSMIDIANNFGDNLDKKAEKSCSTCVYDASYNLTVCIDCVACAKSFDWRPLYLRKGRNKNGR